MIEVRGNALCRLALALGDGAPLAALDGPWEVCDGNDEEGVAAG